MVTIAHELGVTVYGNHSSWAGCDYLW